MDGDSLDPALLLFLLLDEDRPLLETLFNPTLFALSCVESARGTPRAERRVTVSIPTIVLCPLVWGALRWALPRVWGPCATVLRRLRRNLRPPRWRSDLCLLYPLVVRRTFDPFLFFLWCL